MGLEIALLIVGILIIIVSIASFGVSIWLSLKYVKFNRRNSSSGMTGQEVARKILDANGLGHIKVKATGSLMFGNSYSHYFKKVRLRRFTRHEASLTSVGIGAQKASLAILDKDGDPDMKRRIRLVPIMTFGPFAFIPLVLIGVVLDLLIFNGSGIITLVLAGIGFLFYLYAVVLSVLTLKTEKKAQEIAYHVLKAQGIVNEEELANIKELFKLYNIQYINDIILSTLELIFRALEIAYKIKNSD